MLRKANKISFHARAHNAWKRLRNGKYMFNLLKEMILNALVVNCALLMMLFVDVTNDSNGFNITMSLKHAHNRIHWLCIATEPTGYGKPIDK